LWQTAVRPNPAQPLLGRADESLTSETWHQLNKIHF
jgi:hypothetical protein